MYFLPEPQGQGSLRPTLGASRRIGIVTLDLLQNLSHEVLAREVTAREMILSGFFNSLGLWPHHRVTPAHERRARAPLRFLEISHLANRPVSARPARCSGAT